MKFVRKDPVVSSAGINVKKRSQISTSVMEDAENDDDVGSESKFE
jgi:hypothetical protein